MAYGTATPKGTRADKSVSLIRIVRHLRLLGCAAAGQAVHNNVTIASHSKPWNFMQGPSAQSQFLAIDSIPSRPGSPYAFDPSGLRRRGSPSSTSRVGEPFWGGDTSNGNSAETAMTPAIT
jgi:hypothetical protein